MNFIQHIQEIDKRIEERREEEYQNSLFGIDDGIDIEGALAMCPGTGSRPRVNGGSIIYKGSIPRGERIPNVNGGSDYRPIYQVPKPTMPR